MARLQFLGGAKTVTGSKYLVRTAKTCLMVDCGMFQGAKKLRQLNWEPFAVPPSSIDHVLLTHAHIDHVGMLPRLVRDGFRGTVWVTPATREITEITLLDSAHLQEEDARFANKKGYSKHEPALPLYTVEDAKLATKRMSALSYGQAARLSADTTVMFRDAGHILGSGTVEVELQEEGKSVRIIFSGDLGRYGAKILRDPSPIETTDYLLVESTYGNRLHPAEDTRGQLAQIINEAARRGGSLVVPAFALGRTQTLLYVIRELKAAGLIPDLPVYVDSPMAVDVTMLFCDHIQEFDEEARAIFTTTGICPVPCPNLHFARTREESKQLNESRIPSIIISASGMATGGRILHHLAQRLPDPRNTILFMGFQANGTRGQLLKDGAHEIKIHGEQVPVRARIEAMESFSAHADYSEIIRWLKTFKAAPKQTFVVHGEPDASEALASEIHKTLGWETRVPDLLEAVDL